MLPTQFKRKQEEEKNKIIPMRKISNDFLLNTIEKSNSSTLKTMFYISTIMRDVNLDKYGEDDLVKVLINKKKMLEYTMLTDETIRRNLKTMIATAITYVNKDKELEEGVALITKYRIYWNKGEIELFIFPKIAKMIIDVGDNYTFLNTKHIMKLESKHSIRMLGLINNIDTYSFKATDKETVEKIKSNLDLIKDDTYKKFVKENNLIRETEELKRKPIAKTIRLTLEDLNSFFGTNYKTWTDIEKKILKVAEHELKEKSPLYFFYSANFINQGKGRPKFESVQIYLKLQDGISSRLKTNI